MGRFKRTRRGITIALDPIESAILRQVIEEVGDLVAPEPPASEPGEGWAAELGLTGLGDAPELPVPDDPVRSRLFPDAYRDDPAAAGDFRRYTESELRAGKLANAHAVLETLPEAGGTVVLNPEACQSWLSALNDARLALGTALDVDENSDRELDTLEPSDPRAQRLLVYFWLGEMQDSLLRVLMLR